MKTEEIRIKEQIDKNRLAISSSTAKYSIGELIRLYEGGELTIDPSYQRLFRWSDEEQSLLIESIFLRLPLSPIYVEVDDEGNWNLLDGLQRLSSIFRFVGVLKNHSHKLILQDLNDLGELNGLSYESLPKLFQREFMRSVLDVSSIHRSENEDLKFKIFLRLNQSGKPLTYQEIRSVLMAQKNPELKEMIERLARNDNYRDILSFSEKDILEGDDEECVLRFFLLRYCFKNQEYLKSKKENSIHSILDAFVQNDFTKEKINLKEENDIFLKTFYTINENGSDFLKTRINSAIRNSVSISSFYVLCPVLSFFIEKEKVGTGFIENLIKDYWENPIKSGGVSSLSLIDKCLERGRLFINILG